MTMPKTAQYLYFQLNMDRDDDGFVDNIVSVLRLTESSREDYQTLIDKQYLYEFASGICVIRHHWVNNTRRSDRYRGTQYKTELDTLFIEEGGAYSLKPELLTSGNNQWLTNGRPTGYQLATNGIPNITKPNQTKPKERSTLSGKPDHANSLSLNDEIIQILNEATGSSFRSKTPKTVSLIKARTSEGFTLDDFKTVIEHKASQWKTDPSMRQFLRPETLFGTKFEGYLNDAKRKGGEATSPKLYVNKFLSEEIVI